LFYAENNRSLRKTIILSLVLVAVTDNIVHQTCVDMYGLHQASLAIICNLPEEALNGSVHMALLIVEDRTKGRRNTMPTSVLTAKFDT
jgi:hypothetical protein